jgi:serine protease AprX
MKVLCRCLLGCCLIALSFGEAFAQDKVWVFYADKDGVTFDPLTYFAPKAIERRYKEGLPLNHITDRPVREDYLSETRNIVDSLKMSSRWFNASVCFATPQQVQQLEALPFVLSVETQQCALRLSGITPSDGGLIEADILVAQGQTRRMGIYDYRAHGIDGSGVTVAIFDAGFPGVDENKIFSHIRARNGIKATWDFAKNKEHVYGFNSHGAAVLSCIGGMLDTMPLGLATGADFLLARTETARENFVEEENWLAAAEWADRNGADIINSSLGYTVQRYFREDMDGKTAFVTRAANMAAGKGILVVNAAGNEGGDEWMFIGAPADGDSVLSIGGIASVSGYHSSFSSYGPTRDMRMKPNVCAYGNVQAATSTASGQTQGTSFASPLIAGFAACAKQSNPQLKGMELFQEIEKAGDLHPHYDYAHGFGVPQASYFVNGGKAEVAPTFTFDYEGGSTFTIEFSEDVLIDKMDRDAVEMSMKQPSSLDPNRAYLTWPEDAMLVHLEKEDGSLFRYVVLNTALSQEVLSGMIYESSRKSVDYGEPRMKLSVWYRGYTATLQLHE